MEVEEAVPETTTTSSSRISGEMDVYTRLVALSSHNIDEERMEEFKYIENVLEAAVLCQANLSTIQHVCEEYYPDDQQLTAAVVRGALTLACKYGSKPGVVIYLAEKNPHAINEECFRGLAYCTYGYNPGDISSLAKLLRKAQQEEGEDDDYEPFPSDDYDDAIAHAMSNDAIERDVRALVELWPESVAKFVGGWSEGIPANPLQKCLQLGYSNDLFEFMISKLPTILDEFTFRSDAPAIRQQDLVWVESIFDRCNGTIDCRSLRWKGQGFHDFLGLCFFHNNNAIEELQLHLPSRLSNSQQEAGVDPESLAIDNFKQKYSGNQNYSKMKKLTLKFSHPAACGLLEFLPGFPCLCELDLSVGNLLEPSMAGLCQLLQHGMLQQLHLRVSKKSTRSSRKRKEFSSDEVQIPLQPLYVSLATNTTLVSLTVNRIARSEREVNARLLLGLLENSNTTLQSVVGVSPSDRAIPMASNTFRKLMGYLRLNLCGRKKARDVSTSLKEFLFLLTSVGEKGYSNGVILDTKFGLLREAIDKWAKH